MIPFNPLQPETGSKLVFSICGCALIAKALALKDSRNELIPLHPGSIYYPFWGWLQEPRFEEHEYNNDSQPGFGSSSSKTPCTARRNFILTACAWMPCTCRWQGNSFAGR